MSIEELVEERNKLKETLEIVKSSYEFETYYDTKKELMLITKP